MAKDIVCMIDKYGSVYNPIYSNSGIPYHPNAGDSFTEIIDVINWFIKEKPDTNKRVYDYIEGWVECSVAHAFENIGNVVPDDNDIFSEVFAGYNQSDIEDELYDIFDTAFNKFSSMDLKYVSQYTEDDPDDYAMDIQNILNQYFLRVRCGGKYDYDREDVIYFRISSRGYDWRPVISNFMFDSFGSVKNMPRSIWVGHDRETNPPEVTLYYGSTEEFFDYDIKMYEAARKSKKNNFLNKERKSISNRMNMFEAFSSCGKKYRSMT